MEFNLVILLLLVLSAADVQTLEGCSVKAKVGGTVILPVNHNLTEDSELSPPIIIWKNEREDIVHDYWYIQDVNTFQDEHFKGRTSLFKEEIKKGNVSLKICNVTKSDEGKYTCKVHTVGNDKIYKVSLCVMEKSKLEDSIESPNPGHPSLTSDQTAGIVIGVLICLAAAALIIGGAIFLYKRRKGPNNNGNESDQEDEGNNPFGGRGGKGRRRGGGGGHEVSGEPAENSPMVNQPANIPVGPV